MFFYPAFLENPARRKQRLEAERRHIEERLKTAEPWTEKTSWKRELNIQASTYPVLKLFNVLPTTPKEVWECKKECYQESPSKRFRYVHCHLKRGEPLAIYQGSSKGTVVFDGPILIPSLFEQGMTNYSNVPSPWMSLTPMEVRTLRVGTRRAKGVVVVAGLGLGHQLIEVSKRRTVKKIILVEQHQELVDWLLPKIRPHLGPKELEVVVGDAYKELPKLTADVALIDIFENYGNNNASSDSQINRLHIECMGINTLWCWGASPTASSLFG